MDTVYYTLKTRRVKVAGGADLVSIVPVARPRAERDEGRAGEILDLDLCRKRMETKNAWKQLTSAAAQLSETIEDDVEPTEPVSPRPRRAAAANWLELGASAAVIAAALAAAAMFLSVL